MNLETKMYFINKITLFFIVLLLPLLTMSQECTLNIGGENSETIISVFQLNENQKEQLEILSAELSITTKEIEDSIQNLFDTHPQSTPQELTDLAEKYEGYKLKLVNASAQKDKDLLALFNVKQYERYVDLCREALLEPIKVNPVPLVVPEEKQE